VSYFLGISSLDCDSTITIVKDGKIVFAAQEERYTRKKQQDGFPYNATKSGLEYLGIGIDDISAIGYGWFDPQKERNLYLESGKSALKEFINHKAPFLPSLRHYANIHRRGRIVNYQSFKKYNNALVKGLDEIGYTKPLRRFHHQLCHIASAYYTSGFSNALVVSSDGYGSGCTGAVYLGKDSTLTKLFNIPSPHSLGTMYARITRGLGFVPNRHEGKILGLAAYGDPDVHYNEIFKDFVLTEDGYVYLNAIDPFKYKKIIKTGKREDIAAAVQKVLETVMIHTIQTNLNKHNMSRVCLAGGVAANVKMNQRIMELPEVEEIFVHPGMSDCGIGTGVALCLAAEENPISPYKLDNVFFGPEYDEDDILEAVKKFDFEHTKEQNIELKVAGLLAEGMVVGRFNGRMEYGPRALGNRTILAPTQDNGINKWLNKRLDRTEFMPFAPVTIDSKSKDMYLNMDKINYTAEFMTTTTDCRDDMKSMSPAAVHVDGTARPQIVTQKSNQSIHKILHHYLELTGVPSLINTSFNIHEEPIVCTPFDALKAFSDGRLDYLAIGNFLIKAR